MWIEIFFFVIIYKIVVNDYDFKFKFKKNNQNRIY